jgi:FAD:protein FMN transferase
VVDALQSNAAEDRHVSGQRERSIRFTAMGTQCAIHAYGECALVVPGLRAAIAEVDRIETKYSRYLPSSLLSEINRRAAAGGSIEVDEETSALLDYAGRCYQISDGLFDITSGAFRQVWDFRSGRVPDFNEIDAVLPRVGYGKLTWEKPRLSFPVPGMEIDFGGLAKEYAADRAAAICRSAGIASGLVDLGGDIAVVGPRPGNNPWAVGISDPQHPDRPFAQISLRAGALASSGDYARYIVIGGKRYGHIINPLTGWPIEEVVAVSVSADQCLAAGSLSTIAMLMGKCGIEWLKQLGVAHAWMDASSACGCTQAFELSSLHGPVKRAC